MSELAIRVENLGKMYHIGALQQAGSAYTYKSLRDAIAKAAFAPFRAARALIGGKSTPKASEDEILWALQNVSFEVKRGEIVGVIGRNGAGKSTLLKVMSRITEPTVGRAEIHGRVGSLLEVGTGFHPELTGRDNVFLNGAILGMKRAEIARQFDEIVAFAEVERFIDTPVKHYSSGMYLRLAFAVAAHLDPEILIIDEVLAVGDAEFQKRCVGKMRDVSRGGRTVLFVSHNIQAVLQLCSRGILMKGGSISMQGEISRVAEAYYGEALVSSNGEFDLSSHPARLPSCTPVIKKIRICRLDGMSTSQLYPDEPCYVELDYEFEGTIQSPRWAIAVEDYLGRRIMTFASYFQKSNLGDVSGRGTVRCMLDAMGLGTGRYLISVSIGDPKQELIDSVDNAGWFEVEWNNNFPDGEPYSQVYGPILKDSTWTLF